MFVISLFETFAQRHEQTTVGAAHCRSIDYGDVRSALCGEHRGTAMRIVDENHVPIFDAVVVDRIQRVGDELRLAVRTNRNNNCKPHERSTSIFSKGRARRDGTVMVLRAPSMGSGDVAVGFRAMAAKVILHIGVHKTGTTSLQRWAAVHSDELAARFDMRVYRSAMGGNSHVEFPLLCMRTDRNLPARLSFYDSVLPSWHESVGAHIVQQLECVEHTCFISSEGLAYLRCEDELATLHRLLGDREIEVVAMLRDREAFLASYRKEMLKHGWRPSTRRDSFAYVEDDTWLIDFDALIGVYTNEFGTDHVTVLSYEESMATHGSTIPAIAAASGLPVDEIPAWNDTWHNASGQQSSFTKARQRIANKISRRAR